MKCKHYACRCARAEELALLTDRTGDPRYLYEATQLRDVECREFDDRPLLTKRGLDQPKKDRAF